MVFQKSINEEERGEKAEEDGDDKLERFQL